MVAKTRVSASMRALVDEKLSKVPAPMRDDRSTLENIAVEVANIAMQAHREKIAAALRRAGMDVSDDAEISVDAITAMIKSKSGFDLQSLDLDELKTKVLSNLSTDLSERLGLEIDLKNGLEAGINQAVDSAIKSGRVGQVVTEGVNRALRRISLARRAGVDVETVRRIENAKKQARFRATAPAKTWVLK